MDFERNPPDRSRGAPISSHDLIQAAPFTVRPLARDPRVLIGWPLPLGFGLDGRLLPDVRLDSGDGVKDQLQVPDRRLSLIPSIYNSNALGELLDRLRGTCSIQGIGIRSVSPAAGGSSDRLGEAATARAFTSARNPRTHPKVEQARRVLTYLSVRQKLRNLRTIR